MLKRIVLAIGVAVIALYIGIGTASLVLAHQQQALKEKLLHKKSFGEWEYRALESANVDADPTQLFNTKPKIILSIETSVRGRTNLTKLLGKQKEAKERLFRSQQQIPAVIIPRSPLALTRLAEFAKKHDLGVESYTIIARSGSGEIITLFGSPEGGEIFPEHNLKSLVRGIEENQHTSLQIQGVVAIEVQINRASFTSLENDTSVLGLDLTTALAMEDLIREKQLDPSMVEIIPAPLYWANLEEN